MVVEQDDSFSSRTRIIAHNNLAPANGSGIAPENGHHSQAIAGPGPSTLASRERRSTSPSEKVNGRFWMQDSAQQQYSSRKTAAGPSKSNSTNVEDLWELENLVGESGNEEYDGPPDETIRQERRLKRMRDDMVEITDELSESTIITQMLERVHDDGRRWSSPWHAHARQRSAPLPDVTFEDAEDEELGNRVSTITKSPRRQSMASLLSTEDDNDWIEVDQLLDEVRDKEEDDIASAPNESASVGTMSYREALEHPSVNAERIQLVLKTMTNKLLQRKRTVRRVRAEDLSDTSSLEGTIGREGSVTPTLPDVRRIEWDKHSPNQSSSAAPSAVLASSHLHRESGVSSALGGMSRFLPSQTKRHPPSAYGRPDQTSSSKESSMGRAMSKARSAFRPRSQRSSRSSSPDWSATVPAPSTSSSRSTPEFAHSPSTTPPTEASPVFGEGVKAPPPTPLISSFFRRSGLRESQGARERPSVTAMQESVRTSQSRIQAASSQAVLESSASLFPHDSLIRNIYRFMRYSSAAYGVSGQLFWLI